MYATTAIQTTSYDTMLIQLFFLYFDHHKPPVLDFNCQLNI